MVRHRHLDDGTELICVRSGVGIEKALFAARWLIRQGATALAGLGLTGGLHPGIKAGDLIIAEVVLEYEGTNDPEILNADFPCSKFADETLNAEGMAVYRGKVITTRTPVLTIQGKKNLYKQNQALAVDMENGAIARAAKEANVPFFSLRAVCDPAERVVPLELFDCLKDSGKIQLFVLLGKLLHKPSLVVDLLRLRKEYATALSVLKRAWRLQLKKKLPRLLASRQMNSAPTISKFGVRR
jgi:adenosylhomocysteine nucleosidase